MCGSLEIHPNAGTPPVLISFSKANVQATASEEGMDATFCIPEILDSPGLKSHSSVYQAMTSVVSGGLLAKLKSYSRQT